MRKKTTALVIKLLSKKLTPGTGGNLPALSEPAHPKGCDCWPCVRAKRIFHFEMVMVPVLCLAALSVILFAAVPYLQFSAALTLWWALKTFVKNMTSRL